jgi:hypothetical protein
MACVLMEAASGAFKVCTLHRGRHWIVKHIAHIVTTVKNYLLRTAKYVVSLYWEAVIHEWAGSTYYKIQTCKRIHWKQVVPFRRQTAAFACWMGHKFPSSSICTSRSTVTTLLAPHPFFPLKRSFLYCLNRKICLGIVSSFITSPSYSHFCLGCPIFLNWRT